MERLFEPMLYHNMEIAVTAHAFQGNVEAMMLIFTRRDWGRAWLAALIASVILLLTLFGPLISWIQVLLVIVLLAGLI